MRFLCIVSLTVILSWVYKDQRLPSPENLLFALRYELTHRVLFLSAGALLEVLSVCTELGSTLPNDLFFSAKIKKECRFVSQLARSFAAYAFQAGIRPQLTYLDQEWVPKIETSWKQHQQSLSRILASSPKEQDLLAFLSNRWLARSNGLFTIEAQIADQAFSLPMQIHPQITSSYARDPATKKSQTYLECLQTWQNTLPQPSSYPLFLTRPGAIQKYLPHYQEISSLQAFSSLWERQEKNLELQLLDLSKIFVEEKPWEEQWLKCKEAIVNICKKQDIDPTSFLCIQKITGTEMGGICLLPLPLQNESWIAQKADDLLYWISTAGLTATVVELDRSIRKPHLKTQIPTHPLASIKESANLNLCRPDLELLQEHFLSSANQADAKDPAHLQKHFMIQGIFSALHALFQEISQDDWNHIIACPTKRQIIELALHDIEEEAKKLSQKIDRAPFFEIVHHIELMYASFLGLLEVFSPFLPSDFAPIYQKVFSLIPPSLQPFASFSLHASCMTSLAALLQSTEKQLGRKPRILYGENTYFENILLAKTTGIPIDLSGATSEDLRTTDILLTQFQPSLQPNNKNLAQYSKEEVGTIVRSLLSSERESPLIVFLDLTLDFLDSPNCIQFLEEFAQDITEGRLLVFCSRSGVKFDAFGMDQYAGAPALLLHNQHTNWNPIHEAFLDDALQTDLLSYQWFCLAYKHLQEFLKAYRDAILVNTRAVLEELQPSLYQEDAICRVVAMDTDVFPFFLDIRMQGKWHAARASLLIGSLYLHCMEINNPLFYRRSLGFYHPNLGLIINDTHSTIRLTVGLDPSAIPVIVNCLKTISDLL